ncbi:MAG: hypothetical protein V1874_09645 [Spirochaetota bacterium]
MRLKTAFGFAIRLNFILFCFIISCNTYPEISINKKNFPAKIVKKEKSGNPDGILKYYKASAEKSYPAEPQKYYRLYHKRYFTKYFFCTPAADINNSGVDYALKGMYPEAEILFCEVIKENCDDPSALNNLGIIYELSNNIKAFDMYSKACLLNPGNEFFRLNYLNYCDNNL